MTLPKPSLLIISLGELGTNLLEATTRSGIFDRIIVASRSQPKAQARANNAIIGAGIEGYFPKIEAVSLDLENPDAVKHLSQINPDYIFTAPSLLPWWKLDNSHAHLPFATFTALHLSLMAKFRDLIACADINALWIGASFPDVINAVLNRTGFGPDCGIGNVQEPIPKIQAAVAQRLNCAPQDVKIHLVAQHAFEYFVLNDGPADVLPPYLLKASVQGRDVTDIAQQVLTQPFPFPYDLHFNRVTASAGLMALRALTATTPTATHLPGIGKLIGGYPVLASRAGITLDLPHEWSLDQAVAVNDTSLKWDGIEMVTSDGTIVFTKETRKALFGLLGRQVETLTVSDAAEQAKALLSAL
jgi:hypothetical protein